MTSSTKQNINDKDFDRYLHLDITVEGIEYKAAVQVGAAEPDVGIMSDYLDEYFLFDSVTGDELEDFIDESNSYEVEDAIWTAYNDEKDPDV